MLAFGPHFCVRGGLEVRPLLRGRRDPGSKHDSSVDPPCMSAWCTLNLTSWVERPAAGGVRKFGEGVPAQVSSSPSDRGSRS
ncbi:hypothetical protein AVEN_119557-1 [Araneus ventricosus]|uniref:Uncharacterized protein n=1 Tax=Araneus ventricosus TaxID=182803 RepID=A0A4Y2MEB1_ARAVE|nr:hypothetical protein AVEN_119557-1 [Araneus ventricosus]